jgi:signal transduction histidine kinase
MRGRFLRRLALLALAVFGLGVAGTSLLAWAATRLFGGRAPAFPLTAGLTALAAVLLGGGAFVAARALRRTASPAAGIIDAAAALAEGDYGVRVQEGGPPEMRRLARSFNRMAARIEQQDQQRRSVLADVTHELRTPLTVMQGNLEGLLDGVYPRDEAHLRPVLEEVRLMAALVEDLRTLALAEADALPLHPELVDAPALVEEATAAFAAQAEAAGVLLRADCDGPTAAIEADPVRVRQVLRILLTNALQHTAAGGTIEASCHAVDGPTSGVEFSVRDSGSGIAAEDLPHVFERFYRAQGSRGSGVGLAVARNLVALHGGEIGAESAPGQGTSVRFRLPAAPPH